MTDPRTVLLTVLAAALCGTPGIGLAAQAPARHDVITSCGRGQSCSCKTATTAPGTCSCGKPLVWGHVVKVEGTQALLWTYKEGCTSKLDPKEPTKCGCGHDIRRVDLAGTGLHFCNRGGSCTCNHLSDRPGKCHCGMELKQAPAATKPHH